MSGWDGKPQATDEQCREYGYQAVANGSDVDLMRAHMALAIPESPTWEKAWQQRAEMRAVIAWDIARTDSPYAHLATLNARATEGK